MEKNLLVDDGIYEKDKTLLCYLLIGTNVVFNLIEIFLVLFALFLVITNCISCITNDRFCFPQITMCIKEQSSVDGGISLSEVQEWYSVISSVVRDLSPEWSKPLPTLHLLKSGTQYKINYAGYCRKNGKENAVCRSGSIDVFSVLISDAGFSLSENGLLPNPEIAETFLLSKYHEMLLNLPKVAGRGKGEGLSFGELPLILQKVAAFAESCFILQYVLLGVLTTNLGLKIATTFFRSESLHKACMWCTIISLFMATISIIPIIEYRRRLKMAFQMAAFVHFSLGSGKYVYLTTVAVLLATVLTKGIHIKRK